MAQTSLPFKDGRCLLLAFILTLALAGCEKLSIEPDDFEYPLTLAIENKQSVAELTWSEATVSTFEEYVILRSIDPISDTPEPEVTGNAVIVTRIDERSLTLFRDSNLPVADTVFYKVYARIAGRFLMSPTVKYIQNLHLIPARADIIEHVPSAHAFIAFDRGTHQLFTYDYVQRQFLTSRQIPQLNFPIICHGASNNEILISENTTTQFLDFSTLNVKTSFQSGQIRTAEYLNGWIYLTRTQFPYNFALYRRSDLSLRGEMQVVQSDWRGFVVRPDQADANNATIYDFSLIGSARYVQHNTALNLDLQSTEILPGGFILVAAHPQRAEFVISNTGHIVDGNLQLITTLENGTIGFSFLTYSPDGSRLFGLSFLDNNHVLRVYDAEGNYDLLDEYVMSNQISPMSLFADEENVYLVSLVFLSTSTQTLINVIDY